MCYKFWSNDRKLSRKVNLGSLIIVILTQDSLGKKFDAHIDPDSASLSLKWQLQNLR